MTLLCFNPFTLIPLHSPLTPFPSSSSSILAIATTTTHSVSRLHFKPICIPPKCWNGVPISTPFECKRRRTGAAVIVGAAADSGGATPAEEGGGSQPPLPPSETAAKEVVPVDKLPLESKLKEREEQKLRMKLAKKIRLRRKRLVRKRRLRKKGRWPPSKMKKLKNV